MELPVLRLKVGAGLGWGWIGFGGVVSLIYLGNTQVRHSRWHHSRAEGEDLTTWAGGWKRGINSPGSHRRMHNLSRAESPDRAPWALLPSGQVGKQEGVGEGDSLEGVATHSMPSVPLLPLMWYFSSTGGWDFRCWFGVCTKWEDTGSSKIICMVSLPTSFLVTVITLFTTRYSAAFQMVTIAGSETSKN